jgi:hypothetical protein
MFSCLFPTRQNFNITQRKTKQLIAIKERVAKFIIFYFIYKGTRYFNMFIVSYNLSLYSSSKQKAYVS